MRGKPERQLCECPAVWRHVRDRFIGNSDIQIYCRRAGDGDECAPFVFVSDVEVDIGQWDLELYTAVCSAAKPAI